MKWLVVITAAVSMALLMVVFAARRGESVMENPVQQAAGAGAIPAIDAAAPAQFKTATFAAG